VSESFLHYIWQFQYFDKTELVTTEGDPVQIFTTGNKNTHAGPDFFHARIIIGEMEWVGNVEIHIQSSGWYEHNHNRDQAYENVILHVVWKDDNPVKRNDGSLIPTLELKNRVDEKLLLNFKKLINSAAKIPCHTHINTVREVIKLSMFDKALLQRLQAKAEEVLDLLKRNTADWEETCYQLLCRNFGFKVNADPFFQLAKALPYKILLKHADKLVQLEALLFGQAGFLDEHSDDSYYNLLKREYTLLSQKYGLEGRKLNKAQWKFLRLRPANFPTIRLAQLAALLHDQKNIFSRILEESALKNLKAIFAVKQSEYWFRHFRFFKPSKEDVAPLGDSSVNILIINTVVPLLAAYARSKDDTIFMDRAVSVLQGMTAENNTITRLWNTIGVTNKTAFDSQALLELYSEFCVKRKCLECSIGVSLLKP
jgi:hypothetical protein